MQHYRWVTLLDPENAWHTYMLTCYACIRLCPIFKQGISAISVFGQPGYEVYSLANSLCLHLNLCRMYSALKWI